jgi:hypothetical protein
MPVSYQLSASNQTLRLRPTADSVALDNPTVEPPSAFATSAGKSRISNTEYRMMGNGRAAPSTFKIQHSKFDSVNSSENLCQLPVATCQLVVYFFPLHDSSRHFRELSWAPFPSMEE